MPICDGGICLVCFAVSSEFALLLLFVVVGSGFICSGVLSGEEDFALRFALGADELLDLAVAFGSGAGVDELLAPCTRCR